MVDSLGYWPQWLYDAWEWAEENIIDPVEKFIEDIEEDYGNYSTTNEDADVVFSSNYFSCYNGVTVVKTPFDASFSFGVIGLSIYQQDEITLKHEYGHTVQMENMGLGNYLPNVFFPSITINILQRQGKLLYDYYGAPFEAEADALGGVNRTKDNTPWPEGFYQSYWDLIKLF